MQHSSCSRLVSFFVCLPPPVSSRLYTRLFRALIFVPAPRPPPYFPFPVALARVVCFSFVAVRAVDFVVCNPRARAILCVRSSILSTFSARITAPAEQLDRAVYPAPRGGRASLFLQNSREGQKYVQHTRELFGNGGSGDTYCTTNTPR